MGKGIKLNNVNVQGLTPIPLFQRVTFTMPSMLFILNPEVQNFLTNLKENGYHITIASHKSPDYRRQAEIWLEKHGLVHDELHLSYYKTQLFTETTDVVVDDSSHVLEKAVDKGVMAMGLLFPWNRDYADNGFLLFDSLNKILEHILNKLPKKEDL
jgi:hypothetical protein